MAGTDADESVVFTAESSYVAEAVVKLLAANDISAEVAAGGTKTTSDPLTGATGLAETYEYPVVVTDPVKRKEAIELLATKQTADAVKAIRDRRANRTGTVSATCEDCGRSSDWPAQAQGTTELCPHCGGYMDILDPDDDWSGIDFGEPEDETEEGTE
ncbi:hypothetical protein GobsT_38010 [Gemmata obscuriglobus]|uniref:DUF2007 domain-containing protein n=1 Tax=Gemmata obscuriglobus TaxID=114 RepID=A0A2Z3GXJ2_9BACT|nr:hypothetical protein [Gemmata obscuriglobus]AWM38108.1 hypothetical protein C1280_14640 [Gemmata obscuriglobus]QEG29012.1 hypothetical protein GobsT_38010 [Gemmata obscuriglobus]VTS07599.1 Uncharacterized protein OS=Blastopirellula marina DSM 3645 GN=DSM3645_04665 PE=4 SV=1 [Gemmata obscuriglobus UQM 2246]